MSGNHRRIEMDLAIGSSSKPYGSSRSIVRRIATNLPLAPCPRVHFQLHPFAAGASFLNNSNGPNGLVATLADVGWMDREESDGAGRNWFEADSGLFFRTQQCRPLRRRRSLPSLHQAEPAPQSQTIINDEAIQKISALETELAKLRAQIAQIVQAQEQSAQSTAPAPGGPPVPQAPPMTPVPPPPPPPCPAPGMQRSYSAIDLIRERRGKKAEQKTVLDSAPKKPELPNMLDVLKDMGKVKLRSVKSHQEDTKPKPVEPTDAAALIAEALKRKFAHRYRSDSECDSNFNLPAPENKTHVETPLFGQHMLKSTGRRKLC
ncbi:mitochondrial fission regulator 1 [Sinocyclocheilus rhinocerous]|uniref:Mitochondrial fission regulator n=1 Tax=Sinocyclocheilus rhinocerous TaxID=307959 RepID=A0A673J0N2_9TELE|nr:PREDICTED: mitochondrial fission regulator 1 [Sinocyclocheilus rhinocerous]XP_016363967.1 PREDICTED: mitochondrial fission regulator 1 [Sinocyclocheilus rhinocerous]XP_016363968.1 PREDICTED: mitochondrial fission regulator 1 [Sinocyclocheilus rhinocerous]XP_016363969.1 PREDICTED: mitochondrial fission regulator 1 [Sinocyclocheilus rhinocerous]XP_016363970.1 PREDICTED: mitochondrial fission regulator 1 [Sinocyclocheilus rhinocerous]XP_016363971.1 PREDICTED: mitochondrial fission regulator 1 